MDVACKTQDKQVFGVLNTFQLTANDMVPKAYLWRGAMAA